MGAGCARPEVQDLCARLAKETPPVLTPRPPYEWPQQQRPRAERRLGSKTPAAKSIPVRVESDGDGIPEPGLVDQP